tara:strand:- start:538 stop:765 length:228 start_codon:yes stop_codon:yes gene_type:complete
MRQRNRKQFETQPFKRKECWPPLKIYLDFSQPLLAFARIRKHEEISTPIPGIDHTNVCGIGYILRGSDRRAVLIT